MAPFFGPPCTVASFHRHHRHHHHHHHFPLLIPSWHAQLHLHRHTNEHWADNWRTNKQSDRNANNREYKSSKRKTYNIKQEKNKCTVEQEFHIVSFYRAMLCIRGISISHGPVSVRMSVCPSVTSRCSTKTAKRRITQTTPYDSPGILVFWC